MNTTAVSCIIMTKTLAGHLCWIRPVPSLYCLTVSLIYTLHAWEKARVYEMACSLSLCLSLSLYASQTLTLTSTPKTSSLGSGAGFESILTWAVIEIKKEKYVRTKCECSHGPDKARPHFFCSNISAFGSLQGKRLSTNPLTAQDDDCLPVL